MISSSKPKHYFLIAFMLLFGTLWSGKAIASHYAAVDLYVDYIGTGPTNLKYRVTLVLYKACEVGSIDLPLTTTVNIASGPSGCGVGTSLPLNNPVIDTLDGLCPSFSAINSCRQSGSPWPAFVRHTFQDTITLSTPCPDWIFSWTDGSRNIGIVNLQNPSSQNIYVEAMLNNQAKYNNSSPRFLIDPIPYLCQNQPGFYLNGPLDPNNDSMNTVNVQPLSAAGTPINYVNPPYSLANPIASTTPYTVNINTGTASFNPPTQGKFVLAFRCYEYDRYTGATLGYITRDVQVSVLSCNAAPPNIDTIPMTVTGGSLVSSGSAGNIITACPGSTVSFNVSAQSQSISNAVYLAATNAAAAPGSTFVVANQGGSNPTATFTWTPTGADIGDHTIIITAKDSTCTNGQPIVLKNYLVVLIKVLPGVDAGPDGHYCPPSGLPWQLNVTGPPGLAYTWTSITGGAAIGLSCSNCPNPLASPTTTQQYVVSSNNPLVACKNKDTVAVIVHPAISVDAGPDLTLCANQSTTLQPSVNPATGNVYYWSPGATLDDSTLYTPSAHPAVTTQYTLHVTDANGCNYADPMSVIINGVAPIINSYADRDTVCPEGKAQLFANIAQQPCGLAQSSCAGGTPVDKTVGTSSNASSLPTPFNMYQYSSGQKMQIIYLKDELVAAGIQPGFINSLSFNVTGKASTDSFKNFSINMACTGDNQVSGSTFTAYPNMVNVFNKTIATKNGWNTFNFPVPYYWDGVSNLAVEVCFTKTYSVNTGNPDAVFVTNTSFTSVKHYLNYSTGSGCSFSTSFVSLSSARPNTRFNICSSTNYTYSWTPSTYLNNPNVANPIANGVINPTTYIVTVSAASNPNCFNKDTVSIGVDNSNAVNALPDNPVVLCRPGYMQFDAMGIGAPPASNLPCGTAGTITCTTQDSVVVGSGSSGPSTQFNTPFFSYYRYQKYQFIVKKSEMSAAGMHSGTLNSLSFLSTSPIFSGPYALANFRISLKCTNKTSFPNPANDVDFETGMTQVFSQASFTPNPGVWNKFVFQSPYNWDTTQNLVVEICMGQMMPSYNPSGFDPVAMVSGSTIQRYNDVTDMCTSSGFSVSSYNQRPVVKFNYCIAPPADFQYTWVPGTFLSDSSIHNPQAYIPKSTKYYVYTQGLNGCRVRDSIDIYVPIHNFVVSPLTDSICYGESVVLHAQNAYGIKWYEEGFSPATTLSCDNCANPVANPLTDKTYTVVLSDSVNCSDTFQVHIIVKPLPPVNILNNDTTIKYGQSVQLLASGAYLYTWSPVASLSDPNIANPVASPVEPTVYTVVGLGNNGCRNYDSVKVNIDYRDNLFVPSAFTPNGDGKNDEFKVVNLTFQKVTEFRVFNRWGQEIFSTTDGRKGWDGTWKGVAQELGTYHYVIRVSFPDGYVETYKGDVTLVR